MLLDHYRRTAFKAPKDLWKWRWEDYVNWHKEQEAAEGSDPSYEHLIEQRWIKDVEAAIRKGKPVMDESLDYLHRMAPQFYEKLLARSVKKNKKYINVLVRWLRHRKWWDILATPGWAIQPDVENALRRKLEQQAAKGKAQKPPERTAWHVVAFARVVTSF